MILDAEPDIEVVGEAATARRPSTAPPACEPDVVLMDIRMPEMDGIEATRRIVRAGDGRPVRVLMLTTFDLDEYVYDALRAGASGFLLKDVPADQLADGIRLVAAGEALLAPSVTRRLIDEFARTLTGRGASRRRRWTSCTRASSRCSGSSRAGARTPRSPASCSWSGDDREDPRDALLMKLGIRDRVQAVVLAYESGIVAPGDA